MPTYLFNWNPNRWPWLDLEDRIKALNLTGITERRWSSGNRKKDIEPGDRIFLVRQAVEPRGIFASGHAMSNIFQAPHWDAKKAAEGKMANYVNVRFDALLNPERDQILRREVLKSLTTDPNWDNWDPEGGGVKFPVPIAEKVENLWKQIIGEYELPEELPNRATYVEGAKRLIAINAYERNPEARKICMSHYGYKCYVCGFSFSDRYGDIGKGYIHVHHLRSLSDIREEYRVDPIADLRPVCPNCHAMLHISNPPYTIEELRAKLR